ncbi:hypothetical protein [Aureitalea marina]|uniref:Uncharacterized protein n=1 Tax=Aureitalea marina TaxID=930804 RepID=A0A2S7KPF0_9FLAO|nr:hypothetical protein [Aureitalea marina]PQB04443.1 hypothetical protein BST85_05660 [Aureitalea marina]
MTEFFGDLPNLIGIFGLMLSSFLIGYFSAWWSQKTRFGQLTKKLQDQVNLLKSKLAAAQMESRHEELLSEEPAPERPQIAPQRSKPTPAPMSRKVYTKPVEEKPTQQAEIAEKPAQSSMTTPPPQPEPVVEPEPTVERPAVAVSPERVAQKARSSYISYSKSKPELNFDSFGYADLNNKDDLTRINGIGPYIEQRLNEIGIFNYDQISKLQLADIRVITELIDFFPDRIERDNWVGQARSLMVY